MEVNVYKYDKYLGKFELEDISNQESLSSQDREWIDKDSIAIDGELFVVDGIVISKNGEIILRVH